MQYPQNFSTDRHTLADVQAAVTNCKDRPATFIVTAPTHESVQLWLGDPLPGRSQTKHFHGSVVDKTPFTDDQAAINHFLTLCRSLFN